LQRLNTYLTILTTTGRLSNKKLGPALNGFIREGVRFSFSNLDNNGEDTLVLGSRLSFLLLLSKYASWAKKDRKHKAEIQEYVDELEAEMRGHEEFEEVHADDLESLVAFRHIVGLKPLPMPKSGASVASARSGASVMSARSGASVMSARSGVSVASASVMSARSGASVMSAMSGASVMSDRSDISPASARTGASGMSASARTGASGMSARSGTSVASARSGVSVASSRSGISAASGVSANDVDGEESLDSVGALPSPVPSTSGRSAGSRASRPSRLSSTLPTLPEAEKEESPDGSSSPQDDSDTHFSASPGNNSGNKRSQSQMTYEHSGDDNESDASSVSRIGSETSSQTKSRKS